MCGIFGYIGDKECIPTVYTGLKRLEYRGYDSAGIAVSLKGKIFLEKEVGKLQNLEPHLKNLPGGAEIGLGHTRWATHGEPSKINAHPHLGEKVVIVHNGIIENHAEIKQSLIAQGMVFKSETDSETVAHLMTSHLKNRMSAIDALKATIRDLKGSYAIGVMVENDPHIYVAKNGAPLVVGYNDDEMFCSSDVNTFYGKASKAVFLNDGQFARLSRGKLEVWDFEGKVVEFVPVKMTWTGSDNPEKQGFRHYMLKEIYEQPSVIGTTIRRFLDVPSLKFEEKELAINQLSLENIKAIHIIGCGTAFLAGSIGRYFMEPILNLPVNVEIASEFRYRKPYLNKDYLVIGISQSGETADTLASLTYAKEQGCQIFAVCNSNFSSISRMATATLHMNAGPEIGVASTKAFTSQIICLYLWTLAVASKLKRIRESELRTVADSLGKLPPLMDIALGKDKKIQELARKYYENPNFIYMGRGPFYPLALEGALKLKEISYIHAEGYASGELKHGPIALIDPHMPVLALALKNTFYEKTMSNVEEVLARKGRVLGIIQEGDEGLKRICTDVIELPLLEDSYLQTILASIPLQLFAYHIAVCRGTDVDQPRNLAKSVTVE